MTRERSLRLVTYLATAIAFPLNIVASILSVRVQHHYWGGREATAFCFSFIPLALTVATSTINLQYMKKHDKAPVGLVYQLLDVASACGYIGVLVPCWVVEISAYSTGDFGLLTGYATAPMILNMFIHIYLTLNAISFKTLFSRLSTPQQCPNCQAKFVPNPSQTASKEGYSLLRGEEYLDVEADHIQYRDSEDFLGGGADRAEQAEQSEQPDKGKSKDIAEV